MSDGRTARWERHRESQRRRVIDAAIALIEHGDSSPSLVDVGREAGLSRSVVYRHFADKAELDKAVHRKIVSGLWHQLSMQIRIHGSLRDTVEDGLRAYIGWAAAHPALHSVEGDNAVRGILHKALDSIAAQVTELLVRGFAVTGAQVTDAERLTAAPLAQGLVNGIFSAVSKWVQQGATVPSADKMIKMTTELVIAVVLTSLSSYGVDLDADAPLDTALGG